MQFMADGFFRGDKMIFVTLGTQDKSFHRLLDEIQKLIDCEIIREEVIVQAGQTKYNSTNMKIFDFVNMDDFEKYIRDCHYLISHGGVGSIINGLNHNKKVIAVARLSKYVEHENDHQVEIVREFTEKGHILGCFEVAELESQLQKIDSFTPSMYKSNNVHFCALIDELIIK